MTEFSQLGLSPTTLQAVADTGYTTATPIQAAAIPIALAGRDVLGIAQTGTGKTAAFTLPLIERLQSGRSKSRMPRALVIAPTRELADQVAMSFEKYAKGTKLTWALLIGGVSFEDQVRKLDRGVDVLIATPGRLLDHFERGKLLLTGVQMMVVDEADRMLDMGFIPDIERIFKMTPPKKQTLFFSATMPPEITRLTTQFLRAAYEAIGETARELEKDFERATGPWHAEWIAIPESFILTAGAWIGRLLRDNITNFGLMAEVRAALASLDVDAFKVAACEPDAVTEMVPDRVALVVTLTVADPAKDTVVILSEHNR